MFLKIQAKNGNNYLDSAVSESVMEKWKETKHAQISQTVS